MSEQETLLTRKRRGPKPTGKGTLIGMRWRDEQLAALDAAAAAEPGGPSRSEMIRRIVVEWLRGRGYLPKG